jgi:hypothetical protein
MKHALPRWLLAAALCVTLPALAFDHGHHGWTALLGKHVSWQPGGHESKVDYAAFKADRQALNTYLGTLSGVSQATFDDWSRSQRLAFLINAYNAYTIDLVLTRYPDLGSIRDLGSLLSSPWKKRFISLLGQPRSLDDIEHGMIRARGVYDDPRIHMAVNCASIGCPALRTEAYVAERIDAQLDDQVVRFVGDRTRNRFDPQTRRLQVSRIFDWYGEDFREGHRGIRSVEGFLAGHATLLADSPDGQRLVRDGKARLSFLEYDWSLNDRR